MIELMLRIFKKEGIMKINNDSQYREYKRAVEVLIEKGTKLGDMELLSDSDKEERSCAETGHFRVSYQ